MRKTENAVFGPNHPAFPKVIQTPEVLLGVAGIIVVLVIAFNVLFTSVLASATQIEKDIETKDIAFDRKFYLSAKDSDKALELFSIDKIRKWALQHYNVFEKGIITFEQHQLQYRHYSPLFVLKNKEKTLEIIEFMTLLSNSISEISKTK
jgi:hypothetical protein